MFRRTMLEQGGLYALSKQSAAMSAARSDLASDSKPPNTIVRKVH